MKRLYLGALMIISALFSCSQSPQSETYLIPQGFTGRVNVIFNHKGGVPIKYENERRLYEIPANGVLLTQFKDEYGFVDRLYYYINSNGKRTPLQIFKHDYNSDGIVKWIVRDSTEVGVFFDGTTGQYDGKANNAKSVKWQEFVVNSYHGLGKMEPLDSFTKRIKKIIDYDF